MKNTFIVILASFAIISCKSKAGGNDEIGVSLPLSSEQVKHLYKRDSISDDYYIHPETLADTKFSSKEIAIPIQENEFNFRMSEDNKYYKIKSFQFSNDNRCDLLIYEVFGENDSNVINVQLNSYVKDSLVDALLLDSRFTFETEYYREFSINNDKTITIEKISVESLLYDEDWNILGKKEKNDTIMSKVKYLIRDDGRFGKVEV